MKLPSPGLSPFVHFLASLRRSPSRALLAVQFLALLLYPMAHDSPAGQIATSVISVGVLGVAVWMVHKSPQAGWFAALLAVLGVGLWSAYNADDGAWLGVVGSTFYAAAYFYAAYSLISYMMEDEHTSTDELWAAAATFMLLVEAYAWLFMGTQLLQPGAFTAIAADGSQPVRSWVELLFLSGTNFSATGLSDIVPLTPFSRMLCIIEQWNGVMYLAIVVARLAGMLKSKSA
ncbi:potassium channel family protein [Thermomonas sp. HDW16]|uniref:ion channel n=1 Tax=Thermomonas sp. HDW16 TaxID=2714945 RepID=UPI00140E0521|nr:potassium channel family protein [Thermomonas sp. HDW16]QIL19850.1 two pore domain potassium channel family protein [Thermomonas sp. HDW16]